MTNALSTQDITALILVGGRGTRIAAIHPDVPKPMISVAGAPFLEWLIRRLMKEGLSRVVLSVGYKADVIAAWAAKHPDMLCHREAQPLGTGGAVADALPKIHTPVLVILNGDTLFLADIQAAVKAMEAGKLDGIILAPHVEDTSRYGSLDIADGLLRGFREKRPGQGLINGGIYVFRTEWLRAHLPPGIASMEIDILPRLLTEGARIGVMETNAPFIDIGTPESLTAADHFIKTHRSMFV